MNVKKVFISYSHDTPEHTQLALQLGNTLRDLGVEAELDQYHIRPSLGWPRWCEEQLRPENAAFVLVICTRIYRQRVEGKTAADEGRGVFWEGGILYTYLYNEKGNNRFIPVLLPDATKDDIPVPLRDNTRYCLKTFDLNDSGFQALYRELTDQPAVCKPPLGKKVHLAPDSQNAIIPLSPLPAREVLSRFIQADISRIDKYAPEHLIGRDEELAMLNNAWDQAVQGESNRPRILTFVALGGEGKTSLVAKWAAKLAHDNWPGCEAALAWSFYSQGAHDHASASSDTFFKEALTFFGDPAMANSAAGLFDKGRRLSRLLGERRALLILDGLEPLQYSPGSPTPGELKDQGLAALLKGLAGSSNGLCIVTTRYCLPDLRAYWETSATQKELLRLSAEAGVNLLKELGVKGSPKEFEKLVEDVDGHALTLQIMGGFLKRAFHGDIRCRDRVKFEKADAKIQGGHAFRAMAAYEKWMQDQSDEARRELAILRLMGLFDRPATADCLGALIKEPAIPDLTEPLVGIAEEDLNFSLDVLENARMLTVHRDAAGSLLSLNSHPLLREYFAGQLAKTNPNAFRAGHCRLFEHLCATTKEGDQPTLEALQPLYQAVAHGCRAGLQKEACEKVYVTRILRGTGGDGFYSTRKLGAFGSDLGAVACFFEVPWRCVSSSLTPAFQAWLLNQAAIYDEIESLTTNILVGPSDFIESSERTSLK